MLSIQEITRHMQELNDWSLEGNAIQKTFEFPSFKEALSFTNKIGDIAEQHNHHPDIDIRYNKVTLSLFTHSENSITEKDFALAKDIDLMNK